VKAIEAFRGGKMRYWKSFAHSFLAAGLALGAAGTIFARDWDGGYYRNRDLRHDYRDLHSDYARENAMRADITRDRVRLNQDIRLGRSAAASRDAADLARDQRVLRAEQRDIHRDRRDIYRDRVYRR
jgi:hypothetical protein